MLTHRVRELPEALWCKWQPASYVNTSSLQVSNSYLVDMFAPGKPIQVKLSDNSIVSSYVLSVTYSSLATVIVLADAVLTSGALSLRTSILGGGNEQLSRNIKELVITGSRGLTISTASPVINLFDSASAANNKAARFNYSAGTLSYQLTTDAGANPVTVFSIARNGLGLGLMTAAAAVSLTSTLNVTGTTTLGTLNATNASITTLSSQNITATNRIYLNAGTTGTGRLTVLGDASGTWLEAWNSASNAGTLIFSGNANGNLGGLKIKYNNQLGDVWHFGNFTPASKVNTSGDTLSGGLTFNFVGDAIALGDTGVLGQNSMFGLGYELNALYFKSASSYRWYIGQNANGGSSTAMTLSSSGLRLNNGSFTGNGSGLTNLNASAINSGVVSVNYLPQLPISQITNLQTTIDGLQLKLGYTPVHQGDGIGQTATDANTVYIGKSASAVKLKATIDTTDLGNLATENWVSNNFLTLTSGANTYALLTNTVSAGVGLIGGGAIGGNPTIALGTPSTITGSSTNTASSNTHTHQIILTVNDISGAAPANNPIFTGTVISSGTLRIGGSPTFTQNGNLVQINTPYGTLSMGANNSTFAHFYTSNSAFYFDKQVQANGGFKVYSTRKRKKHIRLMKYDLSILDKFKVYTYEYREKNLAGVRYAGIMVEDTYPHFKEMIGLDANGNPETADYDQLAALDHHLIGLLYQRLQKAEAELEKLKAKR